MENKVIGLLFIAVFSLLLIVYSTDSEKLSVRATETEQHVYELVKKIGKSGLGNGQFKGPIGITIDAQDNLYIVDSGNHRVQKFDSEGNFITTWGQQGSMGGEFEHAEGIAVDSQDNVYVTDSRNHNIQKFDSEGKFIKKWGTFGVGQGQFGAERSPVGIAVDSQDNVYVTDYWNDRIQKFDSEGNFILDFNRGQFLVDNAFYQPQAIAIDSKDHVYITNSNNNILKFNKYGSFIETWGSKDKSITTLQFPEGIAVDKFDNIYVNDFHHDRIQKFSNNGTFNTKWETSGIKGTHFEEGLGGIAVNSEGKVFVSLFGKNTVEVFEPTHIKSGSKGIVDNIFENISNSTKEDILITPPSITTEGITDQI
jgi:sugar lactone lactonase YvrE